MWCVVKTEEPVERTAEIFIKSILPPEIYTRCVAPQGEFLVKRHGKLFLSRRTLYPHFVLIRTEEPDEVFRILKDSERFLLLIKDDFMTGISEAEGRILDVICEHDDLVELSLVKKTKDEAGRSRANFISGPLTKVAGHVKSVDFTKRKAYLQEGLQMYFLFEGESREDLVEDEEYWKY